MENLKKMLDREMNNSELISLLIQTIKDYKLKKANVLFSKTMYNEILSKCKTSEKILIRLQYYSETNDEFLYSIKIQTQSITRTIKNNKMTYYINDKLFITGRDMFQLKPKDLNDHEESNFDRFYHRFCVETLSKIEKQEFYFLISDIIISFGEFFGQF